MRHYPIQWVIVNVNPLVVTSACSCDSDNCFYTVTGYEAVNTNLEPVDMVTLATLPRITPPPRPIASPIHCDRCKSYATSLRHIEQKNEYMLVCNGCYDGLMNKDWEWRAINSHVRQLAGQ